MTVSEAKRLIAACYQLGTFEGVCAATGWDRRDVSNRAAHLRKRGVEIPALRTVAQRGPVSKLFTPQEVSELKRWAEGCRVAETIKARRSKEGAA